MKNQCSNCYQQINIVTHINNRLGYFKPAHTFYKDYLYLYHINFLSGDFLMFKYIACPYKYRNFTLRLV
jgi:hypothetical protein